MNKKKVKIIIAKLVSKYESDKENYCLEKYNEALLRSDFLDPFFEAFGWDIKIKMESRQTKEKLF